MQNPVRKSFRNAYTFEKRNAEAKRILKKYPDRIPVIVERSPNSANIPDIKKRKYLVPNDLTLGQFTFTIRKTIELKKDQAMFLFINNKILPVASLISSIYATEKDEDGFLYVKYSGENCFGDLIKNCKTK